ncbi:MAG: electron transfer flavoprotein subunit beta/FixA family protein [Anaerolineae bacterium]|jgi:electron transfer flavoprotein beta subunit
MKIIVPIKQVLDPSGLTFRRDKERMFINREEYIIGAGSKAAIEAALRLKGDGEQVIAISMGEPRADDALREALAMGCDAAHLLSDEAFKEADISVTARILATAVEELGGAGLVITGRSSADTGAGQIGPRLAEALGYSQVTDVYEVAIQNETLQATRRWGDGYATVTAPLPAVITVAPEAFPPRYAHGARILNAYREWEVPVWSADDLGLAEAALTPLLASRGEGFPPPLEVEVYRGDPETVAQEAVMTLKLQKLIG